MSLYEEYEALREKLYTSENDGYIKITDTPRVFLSREEANWMKEVRLANETMSEANPENPTNVRSKSITCRDGIDRLSFNDPLMDAFAQIAYERTKAHFDSWRQGPVYPDDPTVLDRYPNVDPLGKYCAKDMEFAQRLAKLKDADPLANPGHHSALMNAFEVLNNPQEPLKTVLDGAQNTFRAVREAQHAAKVCPHPRAAELLETHAQNLLDNSGYVQTLDQYYTALEHIAGLRQGEPSAEVLATATALGLRWNQEQQTAPHAYPQAMSMNFQNFDHMVQQRMFSDPSNWKRSAINLEQKPEDALEMFSEVPLHATAAAQSMLNLIYQGKEDAPPSPSKVTRGTMVVVDGMTVEERMAEEYRRLGTNIPYNRWYAGNVNQKTAEYVAAGVMAGKRVEAYVPQPDGKLSQQPIRIEATGYAPSAQSAISQNAWERFMNKVGFYEEKAAQAQEDRRSALARERIQTQYTAAQMASTRLDTAQNTNENMFFGEYLRANDIRDVTAFKNTLDASSPGRQMHASQTSYSSLCMGMLASRGFHIEDIMDPTKLQREKQAVGRLLLQNLATNEGKGNPKWLAATYFNAQQGLLNEINRVMDGVSLKNDDQLRQVLPALSAASSALHDCNQSLGHVQGGLDTYKDLIANGNTEAREKRDETFGKNLSGVVLSTQAIVNGFRSRVAMATCSNGEFPSALGNYVKGQAVTSLIPDSPDIPFTQRVPHGDIANQLIGITNGSVDGGVLKEIAAFATAHPNLRKNLVTMAQTGELGPVADVHVVANEGDRIRVSMTQPNLLIQKLSDTKKATDHQAAAQQNHNTKAQLELTSVISASKVYEEMFFGKYLRKNNIEGLEGFRDTLYFRSPFYESAPPNSWYTSLCIGLLASKGHSIEDIMDPTKLRTEKERIGQTVLDCVAKNPDTREVGSYRPINGAVTFSENGRIIDEPYDEFGRATINIDADNTRKGDLDEVGRMCFDAEQGLFREMNRIMRGLSLNYDEPFQQERPAFEFAATALDEIHKIVPKLGFGEWHYDWQVTGGETRWTPSFIAAMNSYNENIEVVMQATGNALAGSRQITTKELIAALQNADRSPVPQTGGYKKPLSEEERNLVAAAQLRQNNETFVEQPQNNNRVVMDAYVQIAHDRIAKMPQSVNMPLIPGLDRDFPGIDPEGKRCGVEMGFAQRIAQLEGAVDTCTGDGKAILEEFIRDYHEKQGAIGGLLYDANPSFERIQTVELAAMLCPDEPTRTDLKNEATRLENSTEIQNLHKVFSTMEQVAGLRPGPISAEGIQLYNQQNPRKLLDDSTSVGYHINRNAPKRMKVNFQSFDNVTKQNFYANSADWGNQPNQDVPEPANPPALADCMDCYASATATNFLNGLFGATERFSNKSYQDINRGMLVIVDGKTVSERMQEIYSELPDSRPRFRDYYATGLQKVLQEDANRELRESFDNRMTRVYNGTIGNSGEPVPVPEEWYANNAENILRSVVEKGTFDSIQARIKSDYNNLPKKPALDIWYKNNLEKLSGDIVAAGLMAGKHVEAYIPGPDGKLPDHPTVLTKGGYEPSQKKPKTLTAWQNFWSKFGFYREAAAQAQENSKLLAARERLKANYVAARNEHLNNSGSLIQDMFFGDYLRKNNIESMQKLDTMNASTSAYRFNRGAATAPCICLMAAMGCDIRDIVDPTKLVQLKKDVGELFMEQAFMDSATHRPGTTSASRTGNGPWLGSVYFRGQQALVAQINKILGDTDLSKPEQRQSVHPALYTAAACLYDAFQECTREGGEQAMLGYLQSAHQANPREGNALAQKTVKEACDVANFLRQLKAADSARSTLIQPFMRLEENGRQDRHGESIRNILKEKVLLDTINNSTGGPFSSRILPGQAILQIDFQIAGKAAINSASRALSERSDWQADAHAVVSGEFANMFDVTPYFENGTIPEIKGALVTQQNGETYQDQLVYQGVESNTRNLTNIELGINQKGQDFLPRAPQPQANRGASQAGRAMGH